MMSIESRIKTEKYYQLCFGTDRPIFCSSSYASRGWNLSDLTMLIFSFWPLLLYRFIASAFE
jgi:hypothetical protein